VACDSAATYADNREISDTTAIEENKQTTEYKIEESSDKAELPESVGYVNDFEKLFTDEQISMYTQIIVDYEKKTGNEIGIVTTDNFTPYANINEYGKELMNFWGVGKKGEDNGLLIIISKNKREVRIGLGLGTEKEFTSVAAQEIINKVMVPSLSEGDFAKATYDGLTAVIKAWK
jgi:uncharacterized protein